MTTWEKIKERFGFWVIGMGTMVDIVHFLSLEIDLNKKRIQDLEERLSRIDRQ